MSKEWSHPMIMLIMVTLLTWSSHSKSLILHLMGLRELYFNIFKKKLQSINPTQCYNFWAKKVQEIHFCQPPGKYFPISLWIPHTPYLGILLISVLASQPIYDTVKLDHNWWQKWEIWLWCQFLHRTVNYKGFWNLLLDALKCILYKSPIDIEPQTLTIHTVNRHFINWPYPQCLGSAIKGNYLRGNVNNLEP